MIPGFTTKLTEGALDAGATINPKTDLVRLTGNTAISTITPNFGGGFSGILFIVPLTASVATNTAGNVQNAVTMPQNQVTVLVYSKATGKWYAGAIS